VVCPLLTLLTVIVTLHVPFSVLGMEHPHAVIFHKYYMNTNGWLCCLWPFYVH